MSGERRMAFTTGELMAVLLQVMFIGFKLSGVTQWSWWLVLAPTWIPIGLCLVLMVVGICLMGVSKLLEKK